MTTQNDIPTQPDLLAAKARHLRAMADALDGAKAKLDWTDWRTHVIAWVLAVPAVVLMAAYMGAVFWALWGWFVAPLGLPQITLAWAMGLMFTVSLFRGFEDKKLTTHESVVNLLKPLLILACGYVVKQFM